MILRAAKNLWTPVTSGLMTSAAVALLLVIAAFDGKGQTMLVTAVPVLAVLIGMIVGLLHGRRLSSVLWGTVSGLGLGAVSVQRLLGQQVDGIFAVVVATLALFTAIGFVMGAFVEFVQLLHFVAHGGHPRDYRRD